MAKPQENQNSHAAGSGSTTGDPGKARGPKQQEHPGASPDDHIESPVPSPIPIVPPDVH
jgi:hypothetical protein